MPSLTLDIPPNTPLHESLVEKLRARIIYSEKVLQTQYDVWSRAEDRMLAYVPLDDLDKRRVTKYRNEGLQTYSTIQLPYTYALVMAAHTYLTSVFLGRNPIHQYTGRHGETEQQTEALQACIAYQVETGQAIASYYTWFYDACKYGNGIISNYWAQDIVTWGTIEEMPDEYGNMRKQYVSRQRDGYTGNRICNVSPFNFLPDPRFQLSRFQEGEFVGVRDRIPWSTVLTRHERGYYTNIDKISKQHQFSGDLIYGSPRLKRPEDFADLMEDWGIGPGGEKVKQPATVAIYEVYVRLIPEQWGLGRSRMPEIWVFTIANKKDLIIGAQPLGYMHGEFPFQIMEIEPEKYGMYGRGIPETMDGIQQTMDWLLNTHFYNVRAALNNQFILDPSKIVVKDVEKGGPGFVFRLRPEAYGEDLNKFFKQIEVTDVTRPHMSDLQAMFGIGERTLGINDQMLGQVASGSSRKTATEIRTSTSFGVNRLKAMAEYISAHAFSQHSRQMVQLTQQYYRVEQKLRIVGDLIDQAGPQFLAVTPDSIQGFFDFVAVDGTLPVDRFAQATLWKEILMGLRNMPEVAVQYDIGKMFAWMAGLAGIKNMSQFKRMPQQGLPIPGMGQPPVQVMPDEVMAREVERGNSVPIPNPGGMSGKIAGIEAMRRTGSYNG